MKLSELLKLHTVKRLPALIAAGLVSSLFFLYYIGILDVSFITRPESWNDNITLFTEMLEGKKDEKPVTDDPSEDTQADAPQKDEPSVENDKKPKPEKPGNDGSANAPSYQFPTFNTVAQMKEQGYYLTDKVFDSTCVFAKLSVPYAWPDKLSSSWKAYDTQVITTYDDGTESTVEDKRFSKERMALELYMGYIIYDDGGQLFLIGPDGAVLRPYNDSEFIPAFTRDTAGRPLFYKKTSYTAKYPTVLGKENEDGEREWEKTANLTVNDKIYYYLSPDGQSFIKSDYNDCTDNRGLYFDYPTYYGNSDNNLKRYYRNTTKFFTDLKGKTTVLDSMNWLFSRNVVKVSELKFDSDGLLITDKPVPEGEEPETLTSMFPYTMAYNYNEGYATVFQDIDWSYDHDKENDDKEEMKTYDVTTNELRVVDTNGKVMFESRKNFFSDFSWTAHEKYSRPLLYGIDSIGSYYFDHGLMRLRVQSWDCYYFAEYETVKIVTDEDILVRPNGERFPIPTGYDLVSYSDGVLLLEKDGKFGYMNYLGNWIRDPEMLDGKPFLEGVAVCKNSEGNYGVIDTDGNAVIPFFYDYISNISGGTIAAYSDTSGWTVYQKLTK